MEFAQACEGEKLYASCPRNYKIKQQSAFFGRLDGKSCLPDDREFYSEPDYGVTSIDNYRLCYYNQSLVEEALNLKCNDKELCSIKVTEKLLTNNKYKTSHEFKCPKNIKKYLQFYYICDYSSKLIQDTTCFGKSFQPSCKHGYLIDVKSSFRGRLTANDNKCEKEGLNDFKGP